MATIPRLYSGPEDFPHLDAILIAGLPAKNGAAYIHPGDLRWWLYYHFPGEEPWDSLYLWEDAPGHPVAWTLFSPKEESFELFYLPALHGSPEVEQMLAWSADRMAESLRREGIALVQKFWNGVEDHFLRSALEGLGFTPTDHIGVDLVTSLDGELPEPQLPPGFCLRSARGLADLESRAAAQHSAFESEIPIDRYLERFRAYVTSPVYEPEQDVVVQAPGGRIAAFARLWPDARLGCGVFEPVGVHAEFQRRGLGRAVMLEGLRRLKSWGMAVAKVGTGAQNQPAIRLYEAVGFHIESRTITYARPVSSL